MTAFFPLWRIVPVIVCVLGGFSLLPTAAKEINYTGHYELADVKVGRHVTLDVRQNRERAEVSFAAAMADGEGAAPKASGKGKVEDGVLSFEMKDNYNNACTCTLTSMPDGFHLAITIIQVANPEPFHFYGNVLLQKTSDRPR